MHGKDKYKDMNNLRKEFEKDTGLVANNCTGIGDYSGLKADADINSQYIKWLEKMVEKKYKDGYQSAFNEIQMYEDEGVDIT